MNSPSAYYLLLLYTVLVFKPLIPYVQDFYSHEFNATEHIATVHAQFGSHHLDSELAQKGSEQSDSKSNKVVKTESELPFHTLVSSAVFTFGITTPTILHQPSPSLYLPTVWLDKLAPPPKA